MMKPSARSRIRFAQGFQGWGIGYSESHSGILMVWGYTLLLEVILLDTLIRWVIGCIRAKCSELLPWGLADPHLEVLAWGKEADVPYPDQRA